MISRRLIAAVVVAAIVFVYAALEIRHLLIGFVLGATIVNVTLLVSSINIDGRLPRTEQVLVPPSSLGTVRLAGGIVGSGVIIVYAVWLAQDLASGLLALGLYWLFLLLSADEPHTDHRIKGY